MKASWDSAENARRYDAYASKFPLYRETSRDLVELAGVSTGMLVIDLACGTGITTEALLGKVSGTGQILAVDASPAMLDVARTRIHAAHVTFLNSPAEYLAQVVHEKADCVICNSAFWQMKPDDTLQSIARVLKPEGKFAFNVPGGFFELPQGVVPVSLALLRLASEIGKQHHFMSDALWNSWRPLDFDSMAAVVNRNGLTIQAHRILQYERTQRDLFEFYSIPIMSRMIPGLDYPTKMMILAKAYAQVDKSKTALDPWIHFLVRPA